MLGWWILACAPAVAPVEPAVSPRQGAALVVLVVVDQLPTRLFELARPMLSPRGGLARLLGPDGFRATAAHTHAVTHTCPGHATLVTGAAPSVHGVVGNRWFDADVKAVYCADPDGDGAPDPSALRVPGIADSVIAAGGKVVSVGLKDRAPVLMGGKSPTAVVWLDRAAFAFTGPAWSAVPLARDRAWVPLRPEGYSGLFPDDQPFEAARWGGRTFPHPPPADVDAWLRSPTAGEAVTDLAIRALAAEDLGSDASADLLAVGYSHTDYVGHTWGAESWEAIDTLLRFDVDLARLFAALDARLAGRWTVVLSSDHGVTPASYVHVDPEPVLATARAAAVAAGAPDAELGFAEPNLWLPAGTSAAVRPTAARAVAAAVARVDGVAGAWAWKVDPSPENLRTALDVERSGDVYVLLAEDRHWLWEEPTGADHGSPWAADQQVPLLAWGPGVNPGASATLVDTRAVAPTLAALLGVAAPSGAELGPVREALSNTAGR